MISRKNPVIFYTRSVSEYFLQKGKFSIEDTQKKNSLISVGKVSKENECLYCYFHCTQYITLIYQRNKNFYHRAAAAKVSLFGCVIRKIICCTKQTFLVIVGR